LVEADEVIKERKIKNTKIVKTDLKESSYLNEAV
jgi:hypothetical protein